MNKIIALMALLILQSCANYQYAQKMKTVAFSEDLGKGQAVGQVRGEDCTWSVFGTPIGTAPTVDRAFINTKNQSNALESAGFTSGKKPASEGPALRYVNNVSTERSGFNAYVVGKDCLVVTGVGYR